MLGSELPRRFGELRENDGNDTAEDTRNLFLRHVPHVRLRARSEAQCWKDSTPHLFCLNQSAGRSVEDVVASLESSGVAVTVSPAIRVS